ncbi:ImmA/IrrE family metallo-endopeptidase [Geobacter sulfurreducens]|uniref:ImmA/IrrE family metallo-endopeptidase n=1 Tax=Geobacter sulfurreducens TaxID=35554 RepID=UPI0025724E57|nr:ImmA/IrrE family metallo-endopeptidase [Geobacter sulfurreducens]
MMLKNSQNFTDARIAATRILKEFYISSPNEIRLEDIAMAYGIQVREGGLSGADARLVHIGKRGIIRVNDKIREVGRKRFAMAHELGHWILHQGSSQWCDCSEHDMVNYTGSQMELEANTFASELLMPSRMFRPACRRGDPSLDLISSLAYEFSTSLTSTAVRYVEEAKETCIVVFSEHGKVKWWKGKDGYDAATWIDAKQQIQPESAAWECLKDGVSITRMQRVPKTCWFQNLRDYRRFDVYEQAMQLGYYPIVVSLLWIIE